MKALKKALAIFCSTAVISVAANAISALAFDPVDLEDRASDLKSGVINLVADEVYAEPGETVSYRLMIENNTGYAPFGIGLNYDSALTPVLQDNGKPVIEFGDGSDGLMRSYSVNLEKYLIAYSSMGTIDCKNDGVIYTVQFKVPADAKEDTVYPITLDVDRLTNAKTEDLDNYVVNGWIRIKTEEVTTTTVTTTEAPITSTISTDQTTSTVSSSNTTSTSVSSVATESVTTTVETDASTVSNTSKTDRDDPSSSEPTTESRPGGTTATTKKPTSTSTTTASKTGDAGVGIAVAALALSGAVAMLCNQKKKD